MDVLCKNNCGTVVAHLELEEGAPVPELDLLCEPCGLAAAAARIATEEARITKRFAFLNVVATMSGVDTDIPELDPATVSLPERIAYLEQELGAR